MNDSKDETVSKCEYFGPDSDCSDILDYSCSPGDDCGDKYCFSCNACEDCKTETE